MNLYHLVASSPWPFLASTASFFLLSSVAFYMHNVAYSGLFCILAFLLLMYCVFWWLNDMIDEASNSGYHTLVVSMGLELGFLLFMVSEMMLFFGFFWAFFHSSYCPSVELGAIYPPEGMFVMPVFEFPLFNTMMLMISGMFVTWSHSCLHLGEYKATMDGLLITMLLGLFFVSLQMFEYYEASFNFSDSMYSCCFYMLTGLHGMHVLAGVMFLSVSFMRLLRRHYMTSHYLGFMFAMWYWHFVDIVWIFLFIVVYCWGNL